MLVPDIYIIHSNFKPTKKKDKNMKNFFTFLYAIFQCGRYNIFQRKIFCPQKVEQASKVAHNRPNPFFSQSSPAHSPESIFHIIKCREQAFVLLSVLKSTLYSWSVQKFSSCPEISSVKHSYNMC